MAAPVDLRQLAVDRQAPPASPPRGRRRDWLLRWGIPAVILAGFAAVVGWSAREQWLPAKPVTVVPVLLAKADIQQAGTPLFQAAGWIEPRPTAIVCSALAEGVVEELLVVEGQEVQVDQPVAKLIDAEAKINLRDAESTLQLREAERDAAHAALTAAKATLERPVQLEATHAEAEASTALIETELANLPFQVRSAEARMELAKQDLQGKKSLGDAIAGRSVQKAQSEHDSAAAALEELQQREPSLKRQLDAWRRKVDALHAKLTLKTDETRSAAEAKAGLASADARCKQAAALLDAAKLRLERMTIKSPIHGRVLSLNSQPGRRLMGLNAASERDASTVITLYDPAKLQVRADVRLEDVRQLTVGQPVQITTAASNEQLTGTVLAVTSQADIQKNTLQVKVSIDRPTSVIRPEMLAQVVFIAPENLNAKSVADADPLRILVPRELVETGDGGAAVWIADASRGIARRTSVQLGKAGTDELVEVAQGLTALDKLIVSGRDGLADGARIRIIGPDRTLGVKSPTSPPASGTAQAN